MTTLVDIPEGENESNPLTYIVDKRPVKSDAFLSPATRELCRGLDVFWAHPGCTTKHSERRKRQVDLCVLTNGPLQGGDVISYNIFINCGLGDVSCCALCREGTFSGSAPNEQFTRTNTYALSSGGNFIILPGTVRRGNLQICLWFFFDVGLNDPLFECTGTLQPSGEVITGPPGLDLC